MTERTVRRAECGSPNLRVLCGVEGQEDKSGWGGAGFKEEGASLRMHFWVPEHRILRSP